VHSLQSHIPWQRFGLGGSMMAKAFQHQRRPSRRRLAPQVGDVGENERA
jgi:hypothetical protein